MGKGSSDSDSDRSRRKGRTRSRSSSSDGSGSSSTDSKRKRRTSRHSSSRGTRPETDSRSRRRRSRSRSRGRGGKDYSSAASSSSRQHSSSSRKDRHHRRKSRSRSRERSKVDDGVKKKRTQSSPGQNSAESKMPKTATMPTTSSTTAAKGSDEQLKFKLQMALKAAADADAQLREQGILTAKPKEWGRFSEQDQRADESELPEEPKREPTVNIKEQLGRMKVLEEINAPGFQQQAFISGMPSTPQVKETETILDSHDAAMFGLGELSFPPKSSQTTNPKTVCVAHENLFESAELRTERWMRKLFLMRQRKLNGEAMN